MKRAFTCFMIVVFCATCAFAQTGRSRRSTGAKLAPGYYFTIGMCRACVYGEWHSDAIRLFRAKGIRAFIGRGYESRTSNQSFAPVRAFEMRFDQNVGSDSELLVQVELYVGPLQSEEAAMRALDEFPSVLAFIQKKRDSMNGGSEGWAISDNARVRRTSGNNYQYGFFTIKGYRLQSLTGAAPASPRPTMVASDFLSQLGDTRPRDLTLGKLTVVDGYALQDWGTEHTGGQALLKFSLSSGKWMLVEMGGGAWDAGSLVSVGVPRAIAALLMKRSLVRQPPPRSPRRPGRPSKG